MTKLNSFGGADPGFQVRGAHLKRNALSGGRRENFWGISCEKSRFYAKKNHIFSNFRGGARRVRTPWIRPWYIGAIVVMIV